MVDYNQRTQAMRTLQALSMMLEHFQVRQENSEEDLCMLNLSLKSVVTFDSQRHLI
jgi:hypothetical protein